MKEKEGIPENTMSCNILSTLLWLQYIISNYYNDLSDAFRLAKGVSK